MIVIPLGVRGSTPAPGPGFVRYGGHTSCVAVLADGADAPHLILDAGTGLTALPRLLRGAAFHGRIVLTHLHWDHVQGLPFCPAVDRPDAAVELFVPVDDDADPYAVLARGFSPPHFPIEPAGLGGDWTVHAIAARPQELGPGSDTGVQVAPIAHKGGATIGVRVTVAGASLAYLPDHLLGSGTDDAAAAQLVAGADVLLHDGQFTADEARMATAYGHSTIDDVLVFADRHDVGTLVLTHHAPGRTDVEIDALSDRYHRTPGGRPVHFAVQDRPIGVKPAVR